MGRYAFYLAALFLLPSMAMATTYQRVGDTIGEIIPYTVQAEDTLYSIARQFNLGIIEVMAANPGIDPWVPGEGTVLVLPAMHILPDATRQGIVINLPELRLFYFLDADTVMSFPVGIGKEGWQTPIGVTNIILKRRHPTWTPPASIRAENPSLPASIPPGPNNPLGDYALSLAHEGLAIHGTNKPYGVGVRSSHGCLRMYPEDIEILFTAVKQGTPVTIVDQPYKLGWKDHTLWLEVMPLQQQGDIILKQAPLPYTDIPEIYDIMAAKQQESTLRWPDIYQAISQRKGIPIPVSIE